MTRYLPALLLTGCACIGPLQPVVTLQRPALPEVQSAELRCLDADAYRRLRERDTALQQYAEQCEAIVEEMTQ